MVLSTGYPKRDSLCSPAPRNQSRRTCLRERLHGHDEPHEERHHAGGAASDGATRTPDDSDEACVDEETEGDDCRREKGRGAGCDDDHSLPAAHLLPAA